MDLDTPKLTITREENADRHGRYVAKIEGSEEEAELTFTHRHEGLISADHVRTPVALRGRGIAAALVDHVVAEARAHHFRIIPKCPYVMKRYDAHPEWADVFSVKPKHHED